MGELQEFRAQEARVITAILALICAVGFISALVPAVEHAITAGLLAAGGVVVLALAARVAARWVRHRQEDRADALAAAAWRAQHAPHLLVRAERGVGA
jgi:ABC-type transport system involved in cytochrome bd biosynthesis fused ATPase/permease subunit